MPALFISTIFLSAFLLFWVQPLVAKMVLPLLGGTPAVWNTCIVFFQGMLLLGYAYAHGLNTWLSLGRQVALHAGLLLVATVLLPISLSGVSLNFIPAESNPSFWLLGCLLLSVGLPFFALSSNGPLLQRWFSCSGHATARDPYYLYAASNAGSLIALLGYPVLLEPNLTVGRQSQAWTVGFGLLIALIFGCGLLLVWRRRGGSMAGKEDVAGDERAAVRVTGRQRCRWCLLALAPSSLMLGVATYLTTDIASIPLLWVLPLSLYLVTFILAFAWQGGTRWLRLSRVLPIGVIGLAYMLLTEATHPIWLLMGAHLLVFFVAALVCHRQLACERPATTHLTEFYLWIAVGGVLGGLFNALIAPVLFTGVAEYPAAMVLACLLRPWERTGQSSRRQRWLDLALPAGIGIATVFWLNVAPSGPGISIQLQLALAFGIPLLACYAMVDRPVRFALAFGAVLVASVFSPGTHGKPLHAERNFFGVLRVTHDPIGPFHRLVHGNTIHGRQWIDPARHDEPLSYYHRTGPLGQVFQVYRANGACTNVGVVGLGAGAMACYAEPGENWTFYEINPAVVRLASDTRYFTFMDRCAADRTEVLLGDARLRLREAPSGHYGMLVVDAFSSDAIPLHLISREAIELYLSKLAPGGILVFHISNRAMDLEAVLGDLARDASLICHAQDETEPGAHEMAAGKDQSHWLVMGRRAEDLGRLTKDARWLPIRGRAIATVWTDDFSDVLSVLRWK